MLLTWLLSLFLFPWLQADGRFHVNGLAALWLQADGRFYITYLTAVYVSVSMVAGWLSVSC